MKEEDALQSAVVSCQWTSSDSDAVVLVTSRGTNRSGKAAAAVLVVKPRRPACNAIAQRLWLHGDGAARAVAVSYGRGDARDSISDYIATL